MKTLLLAATALMLTGSAYAQTLDVDADPMTATISVDPTVAITVPATWTPEQRALWEEHIAFRPGWTAEEVAAFDALMALPPASWTPEQRALYERHLALTPTTWTEAQRAMFAQQVASMRTPWMSATQTASVTTTTTAMAPASGAVVQPSNADPEHDARGIAVISDPAFVPAGYNGIAATAVGGPVEGDDAGYPACTATVTDNCIQLYERGVRSSLAGYTGSGGLRTSTTAVGGPYAPVGEDEVGDNTVEDDALDVDVEPDGDIDVDGDLDNDGDNDLE